ncbi:type VI secretion system protein TssA [Photobacterium alginatilyticum]|uniref:Type VI secretion system protein TssA n=1 Tax=Photobacterium alginatilyticum TaxID=1775171 RepID=A0ABW9YR47_9GAMM|nr:type VI secretion system protein TssA [Photobacterium alginatilyticum]NBI55961.1 type VI secretion system protein TssA [Photobacterium alginatilyticum]
MEYPIIDIEALKTPISDEMPTGKDPRSDTSPYSSYYSLKDVRNNARSSERNALVDNEPLLNFSHLWKDILEQVPSLLVSECKDLEFTAWYIEALVRNYGFRGLSAGFRVATILIEAFWQELYPLPDEDGDETRIAPLMGLNGIDGEGTLLMPISCIPLTECYGDQAYSLWEYEQALEIERLDEDKKNQRINAGGVALKDVQDAVNASEASFYHQLYNDIQVSLESYRALVDSMDRACGFPIPTSHISKRLQACLDAVSYLAEDKLNEQQDEEVELSVVDTGEQEKRSAPAFHCQLKSRHEAISNLKQIADFFKKTEPHSPMAYAIEQVVRWSDMALPDLLEELITNDEARKGYFRLAGIVSKNNA